MQKFWIKSRFLATARHFPYLYLFSSVW